MKSNFKSFEELPLALNANDVAGALGISRAGAYTLLKSSDFPKIRIGSRYIVPKDKFIRWVNESVLLVGKHPENETVRCVVPIKSSLAIEGKSLAFTLDIDGFNWQGVCDMTASRLLNEQPQSQSAMDTAKNLLIKHCTDDLFPSTEMTELALANNISASTIESLVVSTLLYSSSLAFSLFIFPDCLICIVHLHFQIYL